MITSTATLSLREKRSGTYGSQPAKLSVCLVPTFFKAP